ncbi:MAG: hypothetical protein DHS80DRAFT_31747 [Piptocephalis tieghemiana]|nr:MAG: hypothetical protein DHS80DRAFT_31747 [Piptocephalis tieghemiana]
MSPSHVSVKKQKCHDNASPGSSAPASPTSLKALAPPPPSSYTHYERKIRHAKQRGRSELDVHAWSRWGFASRSFWLPPGRDTVPRVQAGKGGMSPRRFSKTYEVPCRPCVLLGLTQDWPAREQWSRDRLLASFGERMFKVGEDDEGVMVRLKLKHYLRYVDDPDGAVKDDSPLYIFESSFTDATSQEKRSEERWRRKRDQGVLIHQERGWKPKKTLCSQYRVPPHFAEDLFHLVGSSRRPPYRWFVMGPARSGTNIHTDPLGTSAWNSLIEGHKRWALFPPGTPKSVYDPPIRRYPGGERLRDREGASWFAKVYPNLIQPGEGGAPSLAERWGMLEVLQGPGETMYVPGGWAHVVINLDWTVAVTQNFCSSANLDLVWLHVRDSRPKMGQVLRRRLDYLGTKHGCQADPRRWAKLAKKLRRLDTLPSLEPSSSDSDSDGSSTTLSEGEGEQACDCAQCDGDEMKYDSD